MADRDQIFNHVRRALAARSRSEYPHWESEFVHSQSVRAAADPVELFCEKFRSAGGQLVLSAASIRDLLADASPSKGYIDPALLPLVGDALAGFDLNTVFDRARLDDYDFGITRATAGIAESGSLVLTGADTSSRLGALAPWIHIAVLERSKIVRTIPDAIALFGAETNVVFVTGPSKTADVEGILIQGVHGPGVQACCLV